MPNAKPNVSHLNMVRVRFELGMYISCCSCQFCSRLGTKRELVFLWNMGLSPYLDVYLLDSMEELC